MVDTFLISCACWYKVITFLGYYGTVNYSHLQSHTVTYSHLLSPIVTYSHLLSPAVTYSHIVTYSHLLSPTLFHFLVFDLTLREWEIHNKNYFGIHTY
jgi:hypothetical protein